VALFRELHEELPAVYAHDFELAKNNLTECRAAIVAASAESSYSSPVKTEPLPTAEPAERKTDAEVLHREC
jgi:hypothetical protein